MRRPGSVPHCDAVQIWGGNLGEGLSVLIPAPALPLPGSRKKREGGILLAFPGCKSILNCLRGAQHHVLPVE